MPSWRRSCVYARGAAARAVFWRGAAMLGVWAMIRRGFSARGARMHLFWPSLRSVTNGRDCSLV